jgi:hypothetical protein
VGHGTDPRWFPDEVGRNDAEARFLQRIRQIAAGWSVPGLTPERDTSSLTVLLPLYVDVDVADLPIARRTLQIGYWTGEHYEQALQGAWGDVYLLDDHDGNDPEDLTVVGLRAGPEEYAEWAADWLLRQLHRPIVRQEWRHNGRMVAATWRLDDTGRVLGAQGHSMRRLLRRRPDRVVLVR